MDGSMVVALCTGLAGVLASITGGISALKATQASNATLLRQRAEAAETEAVRAREEAREFRDLLVITEAKVFNLQRLAAQRGWMTAEELENQDVDPSELQEPPPPTKRRRRSDTPGPTPPDPTGHPRRRRGDVL